MKHSYHIFVSSTLFCTNQIVNSNIIFQLSALEILSENLSVELSGKEEEFGKAGSVRSEFNQDMEEVQLWLQR